MGSLRRFRRGLCHGSVVCSAPCNWPFQKAACPGAAGIWVRLPSVVPPGCSFSGMAGENRRAQSSSHEFEARRLKRRSVARRLVRSSAAASS